MFGYQVYQFGVDSNTLPVIQDLVAWYDASDPTYITKAGSPETVSQWDDKSGNNRNAVQGTASAQAEYIINGTNGRNTLRFDGINDQYTIDSNFDITGGQARTLFFCFKATAQSGFFRMNETSGGFGTHWSYSLLDAPTNETRLEVGNGHSNWAENVISATDFKILSFAFPQSGNITDTLGRVDGVAMSVDDDLSRTIID